MFRKNRESIWSDDTWIKVITLSLTLFFIYLSDAILSFWVPTFIQSSLKSSVIMGFVVSFSSIVGFATDMVLPQVIRGISVRNLILLGILMSFIFGISLIFATVRPWVIIFLISMAVWGLYYEFLGFADQQFVADTIPLKMRSSAWGILGVFKNLAYFLGPIMAGWFVLKGQQVPTYFAMFFTLISFIFLIVTRKTHDRPMDIDTTEVSLIRELEHWFILFKHVWPVLLLSLFLGIIDSIFWTTGTVYTTELSKISWAGSLFLSFYMLPSLFMGFVMTKWQVYKGKKKMALKFTILAGLFLVGLVVSSNIYWLLAMVFISSLMLAVSYPLVSGVYSDIVARMGRERKHMIGLSSSVISLAYIVGPAIAGLISGAVGEKMTFAVIGAATILVCFILLFATPRKLKLPQDEIGGWED